MTQDEILAKQLPRNYGVTPFYRLRWRFVYHNGRRDRTGIWNASSTAMVDMAAFVPKDGLLWAIAEGEKIGSWAVKEFFRIPGQDYWHCKWEVATTAPMFLTDKRPSFKARANIVGLTMFSRFNAYSAMVDGRILKRALTEEDKALRLTEHSIGV